MHTEGQKELHEKPKEPSQYTSSGNILLDRRYEKNRIKDTVFVSEELSSRELSPTAFHLYGWYYKKHREISIF